MTTPHPPVTPQVEKKTDLPVPQTPWSWDATRLPLIVAPMFLVSGSALVRACLKAGVIGTFPALNGRTHQDFCLLLDDVLACYLPQQGHNTTGETLPPFGVNLIVHKSNPRWPQDLAACVNRRVPLIITSLGKPQEVVEATRSYGGKVFADVTTVAHAQKAAEAGVHGLVLVCGGAGGHAGVLNPFVFTAAVRSFFKGEIAVAGGVHSGFCLHAIRALGAHWGYAGTPFICATESLAPMGHKNMIVSSGSQDIVYTPAVSGTPAHFMRESLLKAGYDLSSEAASQRRPMAFQDESKAWKDVWSAGQSVELVTDIEPAARIIERIKKQYDQLTQQRNSI